MLHRFDVIVIGSGVAGLTAALQMSEHCKVALICKGPLQEGSSLYAQGGIAAVLDQSDSIEEHIADTLNSGAGLCDLEAVKFTVENAKASIEWLIEQGVNFTQKPNAEGQMSYHLTQEGGHSKRRIIHAADATGRSVVSTLVALVRNNPNISVFEYHVAVDLIKQENRCVGAYIYNISEKRVDTFSGKATFLATGGASRVYLYSTNPEVSSGDGVAIAWRAGCRVADMEFNQFHPTCLYHPQAGSFLLSEAMRGEGAVLQLPDGSRFMHKYHPQAELAPRDIVARAIDQEMKRYGLDCVYLDISFKSSDFIISHFPNIYERCLKFGIDITKQPIPVVPAAHYTCGGVMVDAHGQTDLPGLYAAGEVSFTGLHGANRMASNSILECLVYAAAASKHITQNFQEIPEVGTIAPWDESLVTDSSESVMVHHNWDEIRRFMWNYVGIVRSNKRLQRAHDRIKLLKREIQDYYGHFRVTRDLLELRNLILLAELIVCSAMMRRESRGLHYTLDYPDLLPEAKHSILDPQNFESGLISSPWMK